MKTKEAYTELSVQLARIEAKVDKILADLEYAQIVEYVVDKPLPIPNIIYTKDANDE